MDNIPLKWSDLFRIKTKNDKLLDDIIQYEDFIIGTKYPIIWLKDGSLLILFRLEGLDYEALSEDKRAELSHTARGAFEQLPNEGEGFMVSNLLIRDTPKPVPLIKNPNANELIQFVQGKKQIFWDDLISQSFANSVLCGLRYYPVKKPQATLMSKVSERSTHVFNVSQVYESVEKLEQGYITLSSSLSAFKFRNLDKEESFKCLYELINFSEAPAYRPDIPLNPQLGHSNYYFPKNEEYFIVNKTEYVSIMGIKYLPPSSVAMYLRRFYELNFPLIMRQSIGFMNKQKLFKEQDFNKPIAIALSTVDSKNLAYVEAVSNFRNRIENDKELPVYWHFTILVRAKDKDTLRRRRAEIGALLKEIGSFGVAENENGNLQTAALSTWPGHDRFYQRQSIILTCNVGDLLSAYVLDPGDKNPVDYLQDRLQGVFAYNPFTKREKAHHRAVCGPTAGGKSFFVIKDLISHLIVNPMVWVVDLSSSFLDLFELLKEEMPTETAIMRVSNNISNFAFNPFILDNPDAPVPQEQFDYCMTFLLLMAGDKLQDAVSKDVIRNGLQLFFENYSSLQQNQSKDNPRYPPPLTMLAHIMEKEAKHRELAAAFRDWTTGRKGQLFDSGQDNLTNARYSYFDLRDLEREPELRTAIVYTIFSKVFRDVSDERDKAVQKRFILDEAHRYIADPAFSYWINHMMRTGRHDNIMLDLITQSINDLQANAILTNLKQVFMFPGMPDIDNAFDKLQLTKYHMEQYKKLNPARYEVMYWSAGGLRRYFRSVADPYTYWLATTDAEERSLKRKMKERFNGNVRAAIEELVNVTKNCNSNNERVETLKNYFENGR